MMALNKVRSFQPIGEFWAVRVAIGSKAWRYLTMAYLGMLLGLTRKPVWKKVSGSFGKRLARFSRSSRYCSGVGVCWYCWRLGLGGWGLMY